LQNINIENIWNRIKSYSGQEFAQIRGQKFTYEMTGSSLVPSTTKQNLQKFQFGEAIAFLPLENTVPIQHLRGPSYLYAILMDKRIRQEDW
jgi:hypothetical protein